MLTSPVLNASIISAFHATETRRAGNRLSTEISLHNLFIFSRYAALMAIHIPEQSNIIMVHTIHFFLFLTFSRYVLHDIMSILKHNYFSKVMQILGLFLSFLRVERM